MHAMAEPGDLPQLRPLLSCGHLFRPLNGRNQQRSLRLDGARYVRARILRDSLGSRSVAEVTESFKLVPLLDKHGQDWLQGLLDVGIQHLRHERVGSACQDGRSTKPDLVGFGTITNERQLSHVWSRTSVWTSSHANQDLLIVKVHLAQKGTYLAQVLWHLTLSFGLSQATEWKGRTSHSKTVKRINLLNWFDAMLSQDSFDVVLVLWINVTEENALSWAHDHGQIVFVNNDTKSSLQAEVTLVLHATVLNVLPIEELAIALIPPAHPIIVLPVLDWSPRLDSASMVTLDQLTEIINSKSVDQVLHTGISTDITVAVITLGCQDGLGDLHNVFLRNVSQVVSGTSEGALLVVCAAQTTTDHQVETLEFSSVVGDDDNTNVVGVDVERVVSWNSHTNLELARQVAITVERLNGVWKNDTTTVIVHHDLIDIVVFNFLAPALDSSGLFAIKPDLRKGWSHGTEEMGKHFGVLASIFVLRSIEWCWGSHDVTRDITTGTNSGRTNVHNGGDDCLEVALHDTVNLKALASSCSQITLAVLGTEVVQQAVKISWHLTSRLLETQHELEVLYFALLLAVGLLVGTVIFEDLVSILGDSNLFGCQLL